MGESQRMKGKEEGWRVQRERERRERDSREQRERSKWNMSSSLDLARAIL